MEREAGGAAAAAGAAAASAAVARAVVGVVVEVLREVFRAVVVWKGTACWGAGWRRASAACRMIAWGSDRQRRLGSGVLLE